MNVSLEEIVGAAKLRQILEDLSPMVADKIKTMGTTSFGVSCVDGDGVVALVEMSEVTEMTEEEAMELGGFLHQHYASTDEDVGRVIDAIMKKCDDDQFWIVGGEGQKYPASYDTLRFLPQKVEFDYDGVGTEMPNEDTFALSNLAQGDPAEAMHLIRDVDTKMLKKAMEYVGAVSYVQLREKVKESLDRGGNIILYGCGSTGRLSIALASIFRYEAERLGYSPDRVVCAMTGGEGALFRARERHEDSDAFARNQLCELLERMGSGPHQVIGITEGGETTSVLAFVDEAKEQIPGVKPYMIHTNSNESIRRFERCRRILDDPDIETLPWEIDPQALTGSTRMQSSTIQMLLTGLAIMGEPDEAKKEVKTILDWYHKSSYGQQLSGILKDAADMMDDPDADLVFQTTPELAVVLANDLSELNPTFRDGRLGVQAQWQTGDDNPSYYFSVDSGSDGRTPYEAIMNGGKQNLYSGADDEGDMTEGELAEFFLDSSKLNDRSTARRSSILDISEVDGGGIRFYMNGKTAVIRLPEGLSRLGKQVVLKMILNSFSTSLMARRGRVDKNMMSYVNCARVDEKEGQQVGRVTNYKLLDRTARSVLTLCEQEEIHPIPSYDEVASWILFYAKRMKGDESILLRVVEHFKRNT